MLEILYQELYFDNLRNDSLLRLLDTGNRAHFDAGRRLVNTLALSTLSLIDDIRRIRGRDSVIRAFSNADITVDAFISDLQTHFALPFRFTVET